MADLTTTNLATQPVGADLGVSRIMPLSNATFDPNNNKFNMTGMSFANEQPISGMSASASPMTAPIKTAADVSQQGLGSLGTTLQPATSNLPANMDPTKSTEYTLSSWYAPYYTDYLAKQKALSELEFDPYDKQLVSGPSSLQSQAFQGIANLTAPERATMTSADVGRYMNPYLDQVLSPQLAELQRQSKIAKMGDAAKLVGAGAYGGSRQAVMEAEQGRNLMDKINAVTGQAYGSAYQSAVDQYNKDRAYQQGALSQQLTAGGAQRDIGQQGLTSDYQQYLRELAYPQEQLTQYGTALKAAPAYSTFASNQYDVAPSMLQQIMGTSSGVLSLLNALGGTGVQTGLNTLGSGISNLLGLGGSSTTGPSIYDFGYNQFRPDFGGFDLNSTDTPGLWSDLSFD